jgi:hypothetical protein
VVRGRPRHRETASRGRRRRKAIVVAVARLSQPPASDPVGGRLDGRPARWPPLSPMHVS